MKQQPGDGKKTNTGKRKDNGGHYEAAITEQGEDEDWPTCAPDHSEPH